MSTATFSPAALFMLGAATLAAPTNEPGYAFYPPLHWCRVALARTLKGKIPVVEEIAMTAVCCLLRYGLFSLALAPLPAHAGTARIYVTNSAGDSIHVIDATTNKVVQVINGIEAAHGINFATDGSKVYVSNESTNTLDVFDRESGKLIKKIGLSARPNNLAYPVITHTH